MHKPLILAEAEAEAGGSTLVYRVSSRIARATQGALNVLSKDSRSGAVMKAGPRSAFIFTGLSVTFVQDELRSLCAVD